MLQNVEHQQNCATLAILKLEHRLDRAEREIYLQQMHKKHLEDLRHEELKKRVDSIHLLGPVGLPTVFISAAVTAIVASITSAAVFYLCIQLSARGERSALNNRSDITTGEDI